MATVTPAETVRRMFAARERGDLGGVLALMDPDIIATTFADGAVMHGVADVSAYFDGECEGQRLTEDDARDVVADGEVVAERGRVRVFAGGCLADSPACWRFVVRAGLVLRIEPLPVAAAPIAA